MIPLLGTGCWAQHVTAPEHAFAKVPARIDPVQASMLRVNPVTAWVCPHDEPLGGGSCCGGACGMLIGAGQGQACELPPPANRASAQLICSTQVGASALTLAPFAHQGRVYLAGGSGTVAVVDATSGRDVWRVNLNTPLWTGAGSDGDVAAVETQGHQLVAMAEGRELWRAQLPAASYTSPLVAGQRVFVLTADRSVLAFDGRTGAKLWTQTRPGEPLVLRQGGVLLAVGDTLVAGLSGRLVGLNPDNGTPRGTCRLPTPDQVCYGRFE